MSDINDQGGNEVPENQSPATPPAADDAAATPPAAPEAPAAGDSGAGATPPPPAPPAGSEPAAGHASGAAAVEDGEYTVGKAVTYGWNKFLENVGPIVIALVLYVVIGALLSLILGAISNALTPEAAGAVKVDPATGQVTLAETGRNFGQILWAGITAIILTVYSYLVAAGIVRGVLKILRGEKLEIADLLPTEKLPQVIIGSLIVGILGALGYFLGIIPGYLIHAIVGFFSMFFLFFIFDKDKSGWESVTSSWAFVKDNLVQVIALGLAALVAMILSVVTCGLGFIVAMPVIYIALGYAFKKLHGEDVAPITPKQA